ncbi:MAG: hypothetical protein PHQ66_02560 [Candidatus Nanoarchaeia archaeon]|nr:hypothetical protein [Candidatus Nanoarchaeia archaeon]MDD5357751.1 hypothetical protein [Candidatus Nanoarchaeia archaeon]MDD5588670.1 hypothetical protein [Candidatus Nanoarchaeia archaeon]
MEKSKIPKRYILKLRERRKKVNKALDNIVENFKDIEENLSPFQKSFGIRCLEKGNQMNYSPIKGFEGIHGEYKDKEGNIFHIQINYYQHKK